MAIYENFINGSVSGVNPKTIKKGVTNMPRLKGVPTLLADIYQGEDGRFHLKAWCPYCKKYHYHGEVDLGHRESHCMSGPLKISGYYFKLNPDNPANEDLHKAYKKGKG